MSTAIFSNILIWDFLLACRVTQWLLIIDGNDAAPPRQFAAEEFLWGRSNVGR